MISVQAFGVGEAHERKCTNAWPKLGVWDLTPVFFLSEPHHIDSLRAVSIHCGFPVGACWYCSEPCFLIASRKVFGPTGQLYSHAQPSLHIVYLWTIMPAHGRPPYCVPRASWSCPRFEMLWLRAMIRWGFGMRIVIGEGGQDHKYVLSQR